MKTGCINPTTQNMEKKVFDGQYAHSGSQTVHWVDAKARKECRIETARAVPKLLDDIQEIEKAVKIGLEINDKGWEPGMKLQAMFQCLHQVLRLNVSVYRNVREIEKNFISPYVIEHLADSKMTLEKIKEEYRESDVCMGETLLSIPATGLSLEEAFELSIEAKKWADGDKFYRVINDNKPEEL